MKPLFLTLAVVALCAGCNSVGDTAEKTTETVKSDTKQTEPAPVTPTTNGAASGTTSQDSITGRKPKNGEEVAVLETTQGRIVLMFFPDKAPNHVENFKKLANKKFYDGTKFHRVIPGFMIQGGDPNSKDADRSNDGQGGPGYQIKAEFNDVKHERGILSMARSQDPDSAGSQFFIMVAAKPELDGQYSAFGKVVDGMETVDKIVNLPSEQPSNNPLEKNPAIIKSIRIVKWPLK